MADRTDGERVGPPIGAPGGAGREDAHGAAYPWRDAPRNLGAAIAGALFVGFAAPRVLTAMAGPVAEPFGSAFTPVMAWSNEGVPMLVFFVPGVAAWAWGNGFGARGRTAFALAISLGLLWLLAARLADGGELLVIAGAFLWLPLGWVLVRQRLQRLGAQTRRELRRR